MALLAAAEVAATAAATSTLGMAAAAVSGYSGNGFGVRNGHANFTGVGGKWGWSWTG